MGGVGACYDHAMIWVVWSRMQIQLLDRRRWRTRIELATAIFAYLESFHHRQRRHRALGMLSPIQFKTQQPTTMAGTIHFSNSTGPGTDHLRRLPGL
jgi:transposase InsO family protein